MKLLLAVLLLAGALRFTYVDRRPMHADEAIQADRFGTLLESHDFSYDLSEYHGPALAYATLFIAWVARVPSYSELTEGLLRAVPAIFGVLLVILSYRIAAHRTRRAGILAAVFTAVAPGLVYYSRSYIPEMMLVCFSAAVIWCGVEYGRHPYTRWAVAAGIAAGLMYAAKETAILAFAAMAAGLLAIRPRMKVSDALAGIGAAILTASVLFSVMLSHPAAIIDSVVSFAPYIRRAFAEGADVHAWYYYLQTSSPYL
jgi:predicted membrane-bound mannosyltransferase